MTKNPKQKVNRITKKEMKQAIIRSGYLLEQRVEPILEKAGYFVTTNEAYLDPFTGKSREVDISAISAVKISRGDDFIFSNLICECENNQQPVVFFVKESPIAFLFHEEVKSAGIPVQFLEKEISTKKGYKEKEGESFIGLSDFLNFEKYHHYCHGLVSTQYCTFSRKKLKGPWIAFHSEAQHDSFTSLILALESEIDEYYSDYVLPEKDETEYVNVNIYYPVLISQGDLYVAEIKKKELDLKRCEHVQYRKNYFSKEKQDAYQIDVISESFLPKYLEIVEKEMQKAKAVFQRKKKIVQASKEKLIEKARKKKAKEAFREVFEF